MSGRDLSTLPPLTPPQGAPAGEAAPALERAELATMSYEAVAARDGEAPAQGAPPVSLEPNARTVAVFVPALRPAAPPIEEQPGAIAEPVDDLGPLPQSRQTPKLRPRTPPPPPPAARAARPADPPLAALEPPAAAKEKPVSPAAPVRPPLPWAAPPPKRRELPKQARVVLGVVAVVVVLMVASKQCARSATEPAPQLQVKNDLSVRDDDLKNRREVSPNDFALREAQRLPVAPPRSVTSNDLAERDDAALDLDARRARREVNPDDIHRPRAPTVASGVLRPTTHPRREDEDSLLVTPTAVPGAGAEDGRASSREKPEKVLALAGSVLAATLTTPIEVGGGGADTVVATVDAKGPLDGARLVGVAAVSGQRVSIRFRKLLLADGREVSVAAEAQGDDGGFGLAVSWPSSGGNGSVGREVAQETATDVALGAVGGGVIGTAARRYNQKSQRDYSTSGARPTVTLPAGLPISVFLHEAAAVR